MSEYMLLIYASDLRVNKRSPIADVAPLNRGAIHRVNVYTPHTALPTWRHSVAVLYDIPKYRPTVPYVNGRSYTDSALDQHI